MERKKVGRFTFGVKEEEDKLDVDEAMRRFGEIAEQQLIDKLTGKHDERTPSDPVVINEDGTVDEVATVVMKLNKDRVVDWTDVMDKPEEEEKEVNSIKSGLLNDPYQDRTTKSPAQIAQEHFSKQGLGGADEAAEKPKHFIEGVKYPEFDDFPELTPEAATVLTPQPSDEDRDFNKKLLLPGSLQETSLDWLDTPADDLTYALEAAKDVNVEDAYPKGDGDMGGLTAPGLTLNQAHQLRGMSADFDGETLYPAPVLVRAIKHPSKYKKGPRKGRVFLRVMVVLHEFGFAPLESQKVRRQYRRK